MAYPRIDTSPLFMPPRPSALSQGMGQVGDIMTALMQRRREQERQAILDQQKADELQFRKDQEQRLTKRQEMLDTREDNRLQAQETRAQEDRRLKGYEAVGKAKGPDRAFLAQLYGGELGQATPDYRANTSDPLSKNIDFLENVEEDDSTPLGFSYGVNPEHERRTAQAENTQTLTMPGGKPIALPAEAPSDYARLRQTIALDPMQAILARRLDESEAGGQTPEEAIRRLDDARRLAQQEALRKRGGGGGGGARPDTKLGTAARTDMNAYLSTTGYKLDVNSLRQFKRMEETANEAAKGNAVAARAFMGQWVKFAQGEVGVLNQSDMDQFWNQAGSPQERTEEALEKLISGGLGKEKQSQAVRAIKSLQATISARMAEVGEGARGLMAPYGADGERWLKAYGFSAQAPSGNAVGVPKMLAPADLDRLNRIKVR